MCLLSACTDVNKEDIDVQSSLVKIESEITQTNKTVNVIVSKKEPITKFNWDWEAPTKPYYTIGIDTLDSTSLYKRFNIDDNGTE